MNFPTINDVKHIKADMTDFERRELINESKKLQEAAIIAAQIAYLGPRYMAHPANAPKRGTYNPITGAPLAA